MQSISSEMRLILFPFIQHVSLIRGSINNSHQYGNRGLFNRLLNCLLFFIIISKGLLEALKVYNRVTLLGLFMNL